ncbi:MAG: tripartite tricarboxylate transporter substrate-binding protein [Beijerinckiaceae bacterium]|nr:tripartite tricarboxylate transporter substrate-binding protein [Beijerinckiaceae bacterium]
MTIFRPALCGMVLAVCIPVMAQADAISDFYKGKKVNMYVGYSPGGGYDTYARLLARFYGNHIPGNPAIIVQNMPGAGSARMVNWLYNVAPKDGTALGAPARGVAFDTLFEQPGSKFDSQKLSWIGSMNNEVSVCVSWHTSDVKTFGDMYKKELIVGGTGGSADTDQFPKLLNGVLGTKFKIIAGYRGGNGVNLAMERGEVKGRCGWSWSSVVSTRAKWLSEKKINVLVQLSLTKHADLKDVPLITEIAKTDEEKKIMKLVFARQVLGRPIIGPPQIPAERLTALRKAFLETIKDKAFKAEADRAKMETEAVSGEDVSKLIAEAYQTPKATVKKVADLLVVQKKKK